MLASCEVKQGRTDGDRWAEDFIETYIDNRSFFFFLWPSILTIRASVTSKMHYD